MKRKEKIKVILEFIGKNYDYFLDIAEKITAKKTGDGVDEGGAELLHSCIDYVSTKFNINKLYDAYKEKYFKWLFITILKNQYWSTQSYYYRQSKTNVDYNIFDINDYFKKTEKNEIEKKIDEDYNKFMYDVVMEYYNKMPYYKQQLFDLYFRNNEKTSFRKLQKETRISYNFIFLTIREIQTIMKQKLKNKNYGK